MVAVSIIVPCFNAEGFIRDAVASIQAQTFTDWECLIVDDCSTDGSVATLNAMAAHDPRIKPILLPVNGGASVARNTALDAATGDWITLLDADDVYAPDRLARLVALAETQSADMVFDDQAIADFPSTEQVGRAFHWIDGAAMPFNRDRFFILSAQFGRSLNPGYMKPLFRRTFIQLHHLRYDPQFRSGQDYLFYANAFSYNPRCFACDHQGYVYRRRKGSLSRSGGQHLRNHARLSDEIMRRHSERLSVSVHRALDSRRAYFLMMADLHELRVAVAARQPVTISKIVLTRPRIVLAIATAVRRRFGTILRKVR
jgi:succinoglycan biosynthesis protein ExoO